MPVFRDYNQLQGIFRSIRPNELLEPDHPAHVIDKVVEMLDLSEVYADYAEEGNPPYHYEMLKEAACERTEEYFVPDRLFEGDEKGSHGKYDKDNFQKKDGTMICPEGKPMQLKKVIPHDDGHMLSIYEGTECENRFER